MADVLLIEPADFMGYPPGGQLNFARQMMTAFGERLALVGICTDDTPVGEWLEKDFAGTKYRFFGVGHRDPSAKKPLVPGRLLAYVQLRRYRDRILSLGVRSAFIQAHEVMMAVSNWGWDSVCYRFPGIENPLVISRYKGAKFLAALFDRLFFPHVVKADVILASGDGQAIAEMVDRSHGRLARNRVIQFPTRVDTSVFHPRPREDSRRELGIPENATFVVTCGRIHWAKGWDLLVEAFRIFLESEPHGHFCFIGDGEDRQRLQDTIARVELEGRMEVVGFQPPAIVAKYLAAADLFVMGSHREGWSTTMVEAVACGKPIVTTDVSGASDIVTDGENGFVIENRDEARFAEAMLEAIELEDVETFCMEEVLKYALENLANDVGRVWPPLAGLRQAR